jgi:hypothetical protein
MNNLFCRTHFSYAVTTSLSDWALRPHFSADNRRTGWADSLLLSKVALHVHTSMSTTIMHLCLTTTASGQKFISWLGDHRKGIMVHNNKFLKYVSWIEAYKHNCQGKKVWHATVTWQAPKIQPKVNGILLSPCRSVSFPHDTQWELTKTKTIIWFHSLKSNLIICTLQKTAYYRINFHENVFLK